jgi:OPA family glycerol-3-phosphate transporter-like MFS transporter
MLAAGLATVLVWCTSDAVLAMFDPADPGRWRWLFRLPLVALGATGVLFYFLVRDRPEDVGLPSVADELGPARGEEHCSRTWIGRYGAVLGNPWFLLAALVIVFQSFSRYGLLTWSAAYYADSGLTVNDALKLTLSLPVGMGLGALAGGYLSDRWFVTRRGAVAALFLALSALCFLAMRANPVSADGDQRLGIALLFLAGFFVYGAQGPLWAMCPELVGSANSGTAVGLMDAVAYAGAAAQGPLLGYLVGTRSGYPALFLALAVATSAGAVLAVASAATSRVNKE